MTILEKFNSLEEYVVHLRTKSREYYHKNRTSELAKRTKKYTCGCGSVISASTKCLHMRTKKHARYLEYQEELRVLTERAQETGL